MATRRAGYRAAACDRPESVSVGVADLTAAVQSRSRDGFCGRMSPKPSTLCVVSHASPMKVLHALSRHRSARFSDSFAFQIVLDVESACGTRPTTAHVTVGWRGRTNEGPALRPTLVRRRAPGGLGSPGGDAAVPDGGAALGDFG